MANSDVGTKPRSVKVDTTMYGLKSTKSSSLVEDLHKSRRELVGYKDSRRDSESVKARAEVELSKAKKFVEELTLLIEKSNRSIELLNRDMDDLEIDTKVEESGDFVEVLKDLEVVKEDVSRLKLDVVSVLGERDAAEEEVEELRFKTEGNLRLIESLEKEIEVANEEYFLVELGKMEALKEYKEIERRREGEGKVVLDLLAERKKRIKEMVEEVERSKSIEKELFETTSDVEMLETQLKLVKEMERRGNSMSRSNRSFERGKSYSLSALKVVTEATEAKKEELASVNAELFRFMTVMDALRSEVIQAKEETARFEEILRKADVKIQKLNSKMLLAKSKLEIAMSERERASSLADSLAGSLEKLKRNREAAKREERLLKEEKMITKAETQKTKLEIDERERELFSKLDELEKAKHSESFVLEKLESLIEDTMQSREIESEHCSTITISRFEYQYLSRHAYLADETAEKKVAAAEAWIEAIKSSTKEVSMKTETLIRESGITKRLVESEIEKIKRNSEAESFLSPKPAQQRGKAPRRYSSAGTPTFFVIKKKKKVQNLVNIFGRRRLRHVENNENL